MTFKGAIKNMRQFMFGLSIRNNNQLFILTMFEMKQMCVWGYVMKTRPDHQPHSSMYSW